MAFMEKKLPIERCTGDAKTAAAASPWAARPPPSSRAIRPTRTRVAAQASSATLRIASSEVPNSSVAARSAAIESGG